MRYFTTILFVTLCFSSTIVIAESRHQATIPELIRELELTPTQIARLKNYSKQHRNPRMKMKKTLLRLKTQRVQDQIQNKERRRRTFQRYQNSIEQQRRNRRRLLSQLNPAERRTLAARKDYFHQQRRRVAAK